MRYMKISEIISIFSKGISMGVVNVLPVSSGTISLILGVFERFVNSIKSLNHKNFKLLRERRFPEFAKRTDLKFLSILMLGVLAGMVLTAVFLKSVFSSHEVYTWSFFIGLIVASVIYILKTLEQVNLKIVLLMVLGTAVSFLLSIRSNPVSNDSFWYLFLCGIIGTTGMVVPGISGSHLMLLMGNYELIVTEAIPNLTHWATFGQGMKTLLPFALGAVVSIVMFSHLLSWLMKEWRDETLSVLSGFMLGSLPVVYPWKTTSPDVSEYIFSWPPLSLELLVAVVFALLGAGLVLLLETLAKRKESVVR